MAFLRAPATSPAVTTSSGSAAIHRPSQSLGSRSSPRLPRSWPRNVFKRSTRECSRPRRSRSSPAVARLGLRCVEEPEGAGLNVVVADLDESGADDLHVPVDVGVQPRPQDHGSDRRSALGASTSLMNDARVLLADHSRSHSADSRRNGPRISHPNIRILALLPSSTATMKAQRSGKIVDTSSMTVHGIRASPLRLVQVGDRR